MLTTAAYQVKILSSLLHMFGSDESGAHEPCVLFYRELRVRACLRMGAAWSGWLVAAGSMQAFTVASRLSVRAAVRAVLIASVCCCGMSMLLCCCVGCQCVSVCGAVCLHCCVSGCSHSSASTLRLGALALCTAHLSSDWAVLLSTLTGLFSRIQSTQVIPSSGSLSLLRTHTIAQQREGMCAAATLECVRSWYLAGTAERLVPDTG